MNFRQVLEESYFDGLYHFSNSKNLTLENLKIKPVEKLLPMKPKGGLWLCKGLSWLTWNRLEGENYATLDHYLYRVKLKPKAKILNFTKDNVAKFNKNKNEEDKDWFANIEWEKLSKQYDGFQVYHERSMGSNFYGWDVPSIVVFNKDAIQSIESMGSVAKAIDRKRKK